MKSDMPITPGSRSVSLALLYVAEAWLEEYAMLWINVMSMRTFGRKATTNIYLRSKRWKLRSRGLENPFYGPLETLSEKLYSW